MTRTRYRIRETEYPYFLTCTVVGWLPVFTRPEAVRILFDCSAPSCSKTGTSACRVVTKGDDPLRVRFPPG